MYLVMLNCVMDGIGGPNGGHTVLVKTLSRQITYYCAIGDWNMLNIQCDVCITEEIFPPNVYSIKIVEPTSPKKVAHI